MRGPAERGHRVKPGCLQVLASVEDTEPLTRSASFRTIATQPGQVELLDNTESREPLCAQHAGGVAQPRSKNHLAAQLRSLLDQAAGSEPDSCLSHATPLQDLSRRGLGELSSRIRGRSLDQGRRGSVERGNNSQAAGGAGSVESSAHGPQVLDRALERASGGLLEVLDKGSGVEMWCENRCAPAVRAHPCHR